jgi:hypothetical protein
VQSLALGGQSDSSLRRDLLVVMSGFGSAHGSVQILIKALFFCLSLSLSVKSSTVVEDGIRVFGFPGRMLAQTLVA